MATECGLPSVGNEALWPCHGAMIALWQFMVTAHRIGNIRIDVRGREHNPPHVHIDGPNGPVRVFLNDMTVLGSRKAIRASGEALAWVEANRQALLQLWEELNP